MARYKTGIESKNKIYGYAKWLFYVHGYEKTSVAMIAEAAGVPKGLVSYYFKKEELLTTMHEELILSIFGAIRQLGRRVENSLQWHLLLLQIFYRVVHDDEHKLRAYTFLLEHGIASKKTNDMVNEQLLREIVDFKLDISPQQYLIYITAQYGAYRQIRKDYMKTFDPEKNKPYIFLAGTVALRMAGIDHRILEENIAKADAMLSDIDYSDITFLAQQPPNGGAGTS